MKYGERIKKLREERQISQTHLAEILELSRSSITKYEREEREPSIDVLLKMSDYFGVSVDYITGNTDEDEINTHRLNKMITELAKLDINSFSFHEKFNDEQRISIRGLLYDYLSLVNDEYPMAIDFIYLSCLFLRAAQEYFFTLFGTLFDVDNNGKCFMKKINTGELLVINEAKDTLYANFQKCSEIIYSWVLWSDIDCDSIFNLDEIINKYYTNNRGKDFVEKRKGMYDLLKKSQK